MVTQLVKGKNISLKNLYKIKFIKRVTLARHRIDG